VSIQVWDAAPPLRDMPHVISVRVCAPMDFRVRVVMDRLGTKDANAVREQIERYEAARARTMRALFDTEQEDPRLYHIVLNTERLPIDACVKAICDLAESPRFRDRATTRSMLANKLLEAKIGSAFVEHISFPRRRSASPWRSPTARSRLPAQPAAGACARGPRRSPARSRACAVSTTASSACPAAAARSEADSDQMEPAPVIRSSPQKRGTQGHAGRAENVLLDRSSEPLGGRLKRTSARRAEPSRVMDAGCLSTLSVSLPIWPNPVLRDGPGNLAIYA
jgi:Cytidylate kinase-like family